MLRFRWRWWEPRRPIEENWHRDEGNVERTLAVVGVLLSLLVAAAFGFHWIGSDQRLAPADRALIESLGNAPQPVRVHPSGSSFPSTSSSTSTSPSSTTTSPAVARQSVQLEMPNHCVCEGPRSQAQLKVKVTVTNNTNNTLDVSANRFRLIVSEPLGGEWSPPPGTAPIQELVAGGKTLAAIAPNPDAFAEEIGGQQTFATHWSATTLAPGATYSDPTARHADLVFYVPASSDGTVSFLGLGYVTTNGQLLGYLPSSSWGVVADPNTF
jgi:hypothetical protein